MNGLLYFLLGIAVLAFGDLLRAIIGPTAADRVVAANAVSTKVTIAILLLALLQENYVFLDIALVFVLCGFVGMIAILRYLLPENQKELLAEIRERPAQLQVSAAKEVIRHG